MKCPYCKHNDTIVKDSRTTSDKDGIKRRRQCTNCKTRFSSIEMPISKNLVVIKRSGAKKPFDQSKIYNSILTALRKRNVDRKIIDKIVEDICVELYSSNEKEIQTIKIGNMILSDLKKIDEVAYIRFASVYKDFNSMQDFSRFINTNIKKIQ